MRKFVRYIVILLILLLGMSAISGCGLFKFGETEESTDTHDSTANIDTESQITEDGVMLLDTPIVIAEGKNAYFKSVRPDVNNDIFATCIAELRNPADGFTLSFGVAREADNENTDGEILIGNTCRPQSKAEMDKIGYDDFSITYVENKIVVVAHTSDRLVEAVAFLKEKLLRVNGDRLEYIGDYIYKSDAALMIDEGESIADYKIVCGHDNLYMRAYNVQQYIKNKYGVTLDIIFDNKPKEGKEIVLGNANRDIAKLAEGVAATDAIIAVQDKDLLVSANNYATIVRAVEYFEREYLSGIFTDGFNFKADMMETYNVHKDSFNDSNNLAGGADLRIMSFNVLCELYNEKPPISGRDIAVASVIINYLPDVVGLQEMSPNWHKALESMLSGSPYKMIEKKNTLENKVHQNINFSPIIYNSDTVTYIESGIKEYSAASKPFAYVMTWGYFEHKVSGEKFVVINTHLDLRNKEEPYLTNRATQAAEMAAFINEMKERYNCPVITTGDYNTTEAEDGYKTITGVAQVSEAKYTAKKINRQCVTYHDLGKTVSVSKANSIDHIFGTDRVEFMYFNVLVDKTVINASDHCPIYADVKFN